MAQDDDSQKTEQPSQRRLEDAVQKGQLIYSKDLTNFFTLLVFFCFITWFLPTIMQASSLNLTKYIELGYQFSIDEHNIGSIIIKAMTSNMLLILAPMLVIIIISVFSSFIQNDAKLIISSEPMMPKLEKLSLIKGMKKLFSIRSLVELIKNIIKILVVSLVCYLAIKSRLNKLNLIHNYNILAILNYLYELLNEMLLMICITVGFIGAIDYLYQRYEFYKSLRMSKEELKEEYKQSEGSPEIKAKIRSIRNERARKRMMSAVPSADLIITNPTHYSIALKYDILTMKAPKVVAKGQDLIALKIREIAKEHDIPIIENKPLAQALFAKVKIDAEIPFEYYQVVAELISYVYKLKGRSFS